ncbi:hypothetical protein VULLAG_LOCUS12071 [Vulpes lagopus]
MKLQAEPCGLGERALAAPSPAPGWLRRKQLVILSLKMSFIRAAPKYLSYDFSPPKPCEVDLEPQICSRIFF